MVKEIWEEEIFHLWRWLESSPSQGNGQLGIREKEPGLHVRRPGTTAMDLLNISGKALALRGGKPNCRNTKPW